MEKKLPKVYANKIDKQLTNNKKIYNSNEIEDNDSKKETNKQNKTKISTDIKKTKIKENEQTIETKINEIINSRNYIYKIPVKIQTEDNEIITKIIGKNRHNIITIENKLIKIENIKDIEIYEE